MNHSKDLSPTAIKKAVVAEVTQNPITLLSAMGFCLSGAFALLIEPSVMAFSILGASGIVGSSMFGWNVFVKGDEYANSIIAKYRAELEKDRLNSITKLSEEFSELGNQNGIEQLELFENKYQTFVKVLEHKFDPEEFTYNRYRTIAEQVFLGGIDNLTDAAIALRSIESIDLDYLDQKLDEHEAAGTSDKASAIKERIEIHKEQMSRVEKILHENEVAMTSLDKVTSKISSIDTKPGVSTVDYEQAMEELHRLIQRTENYSVK